MQRWEYLVLEVEQDHPRLMNGQELRGWDSLKLYAVLNQLGEEGWEMVGTQSTPSYTFAKLFFKRPRA
jgi:hypothetical protein